MSDPRLLPSARHDGIGRFVFGVAAVSRNTRFQAARYDLTWAGLAPADRASFCWRLRLCDHLIGDRLRPPAAARATAAPGIPSAASNLL